MKGKLRGIVKNKNFGFVINTQGTEYFFHKSDFNGFWSDLEEDYGKQYEVELEFEPLSTPKGKRAANVRRIDSGVIMDISDE